MKHLTSALLVISLTFFSVFSSLANSEPVAQGSLEGAFSSWGKSSVEGDWKIVESDGKTFIELGENFKAKDGPDVKIFLSPTEAKDITSDNATNGSVFVFQITSFKGKSLIEIPTGTNLNDYKSLVFHCEAYSKLWGTSALN